jgi:hypothetical protein
VRHQPVSLAQVWAASEDMGAMFDFLSETGYQVDLPALRADFPAVEWTPYARWAASVDWPAVT